MENQSLKKQAIHGVGWSALENLSKYGISFFISIVLARLLTPNEYGLLGILSIFITLFNAIVDSGFTNALIRKKNVTDIDYSTVFYINLLLSIFMAIALFLCAKPIAVFFKREELFALTRVMSSVVVINAFSIVQKARLIKTLSFKLQTKVTVFSTIISGLIGIYCAYNGWGVWALVAQQITMQLFATILLWIYNKWIPLFAFSIKSFSEMWSFGWKLLVSKIIDSLWQEVYQVVIAKCYTSNTLGLFTRAKQFSDLCSSNLTVVIQRVSYPVLSKIQNEPIRLKIAYQHIIRLTMLITFTLMIGLAACSNCMIPFLIGNQWGECIPMLQIMCIYGMFYPLHAINLNMLQVQGRSDLFLKLEVAKKIVFVFPLLLGIFIGLYWMLISTIIANIISYYLNAYYSGSFLDYSIKEQVKDILPSFLIAITMGGIVYLTGLIQVNIYILFPMQVSIGILSTCLLCECCKLPEYLEIKHLILRKNKK